MTDLKIYPGTLQIAMGRLSIDYQSPHGFREKELVGLPAARCEMIGSHDSRGVVFYWTLGDIMAWRPDIGKKCVELTGGPK